MFNGTLEPMEDKASERIKDLGKGSITHENGEPSHPLTTWIRLSIGRLSLRKQLRITIDKGDFHLGVPKAVGSESLGIQSVAILTWLDRWLWFVVTIHGLDALSMVGQLFAGVVGFFSARLDFHAWSNMGHARLLVPIQSRSLRILLLLCLGWAQSCFPCLGFVLPGLLGQTGLLPGFSFSPGYFSRRDSIGVTTLKASKDIKKLSMEELCGTLKVHEIELDEDKGQHKSKIHSP
ncbi:hypothetical protein CR513_36997, partial [Mucuna pruriens]